MNDAIAIPNVPPPARGIVDLGPTPSMAREDAAELEGRRLRARAAIRVAIAAQDEKLGDCGARDRNLRIAAEYERAAGLGWRRTTGRA